MPTRPLVTSYRQDMALFPDAWHKVGVAFWVVVLVAIPVFANAYWLGVANLACVAVVGAVGLMILTGFTGQISLGHAAFLALGAYTAAVLGEQLRLPFWLVLPISGAVAAAVGLAVGPFALRLRGLYLAIVTLGLLFLVQHLLLSLPDLTHGPSGIRVGMYWWFSGEDAKNAYSMSKPWTVAGVKLDYDRKLYGLFVVLAVGAALWGAQLARSNSGRAMMAVRDQDLAASVLGVNPARVKGIAFGISSFLGGVAGAMYGWQQQYITVKPPFDLGMSIDYIAMCVLGGVGTTFGAVAGAISFVVLEPLAERVGEHLPLVNQLTSNQQSTVLFALLVIGFLLFEPMGLLGIWLRVKRYFLGWPFRY